MLAKIKSRIFETHERLKLTDRFTEVRRRMTLDNLKKIFEEIDWQDVGEKLDPERITTNPKFKQWVDKLNLPAYVKGVDTEVEFLPAALEIVETPPSPASRVVAKTIMAFFVIALLWASIGTVDIIASASGKIISAARTKIIQPLESGVVRTIHVQDGQTVKAGDVLIEIDSTVNESERDRLHKEYIEGMLNSARLKAALNLSDDPISDFTPPKEATETQILMQTTLLLNQVQEIKAKLDGVDQQIAQQLGNLTAVQATINKLTQSIPYLEKRAEARDYLAKKGYGSKLEYYTTQQDLVEHQQELLVQEGKLAEATGSVAALQQQRKQAEAEWRRTNLNELTQIEQKTASIQEQLVQATQKFRLQTLTAPVNGTVQQLAVHTEGGVVTPAQVLLAIVPADARVEIEATVSNRDIGFVHAGQDAEVKVDTFNFTKYGLLHGRVMSVSQDAVLRNQPDSRGGSNRQIGAESDSSEPNGQELIYTARVALDETQMWVDDRLVNLTPGMAVTVEIKTGSRHIISYLLSPVQKHMHQALRER